MTAPTLRDIDDGDRRYDAWKDDHEHELARPNAMRCRDPRCRYVRYRLPDASGVWADRWALDIIALGRLQGFVDVAEMQERRR